MAILFFLLYLDGKGLVLDAFLCSDEREDLGGLGIVTVLVVQ